MHKIIKIKYQSTEYEQVLQLRNNVLRKPLGLDLFNEDLTDDANQLIYGIIAKNKIIACVQVVPLKNNIYKLRQMAVNSKYQKKGLGSKLIYFVECELLKKQAKKIELHARKTAIDFYKKSGYKIISNEFIEVGIKHYKMNKNL